MKIFVEHHNPLLYLEDQRGTSQPENPIKQINVQSVKWARDFVTLTIIFLGPRSAGRIAHTLFINTKKKTKTANLSLPLLLENVGSASFYDTRETKRPEDDKRKYEMYFLLIWDSEGCCVMLWNHGSSTSSCKQPKRKKLTKCFQSLFRVNSYQSLWWNWTRPAGIVNPPPHSKLKISTKMLQPNPEKWGNQIPPNINCKI